VNGRSTARALAYGIAAAVVVAVAYAVFAEILQFTLGLLVVGFAGGWLIGNAVAYGAWSGREHAESRRLRWTAVAISALAWVGALILAFVISQALLPDASTALADRLTVNGFVDYFTGFGILRIVDLLAVALMAVMAWRGAR
jgi:hypothetical protein